MASKKLVSLAVAVALTASSPITKAIGLGDLESPAVLNQPLQIKIPIIESNYEEHGFEAKLADRAMHDRLGIAYPSHLPKLYFNATASPEGPALSVTSIRPIKEPIVNFLVQVNYGESKIVKEITLFLDPIEFALPVLNQRSPSLISAERKITDRSNSSVNTVAAKSRVEQSVEQSINNQIVTVQSGQSLWRIARSWEAGDVSINHKMNAIFLANPDAFVNNDRNRLKLGSQLVLSTDAFIRQAVSTTQVESQRMLKQANMQATMSKDVSSIEDSILEPKSAPFVATTTEKNSVLQGEVQKQLALEKQLKEVNERIKAQLVINSQLRDSLAKATSQTSINTTGELSLPKVDKQAVSRSANAKSTDTLQPVDEAFVGNFSSSEMTRNNWLLVIGVSLAILFAHILWIVSRNRKTKYFSKMLDLKFKKFSSQSDKDDQMGHSVKKIKIPVGRSSNTQIKYLNSAAEFYIRCERFDLAKELVNESLIQFCNDPKIIKAIGKIRIRIFKELDAHLHTNISSKSGDAIRPDPEMIIDIIDEFEMDEEEIELGIPWNKKVS